LTCNREQDIKTIGDYIETKVKAVMRAKLKGEK
jgi:hypothetical protein